MAGKEAALLVPRALQLPVSNRRVRGGPAVPESLAGFQTKTSVPPAGPPQGAEHCAEDSTQAALALAARPLPWSLTEAGFLLQLPSQAAVGRMISLPKY